MQQKSKQNQKNKRRGNTQGGGRNGPPQFSSNIRVNHRFRFLCTTSAFSGTVSPAKMAGAAGVIGTVTNTTASLIYFAMRVKSIEMWSPPASQGAASTCSVEWVGGGNNPNIEISDTTVSVATPAHVMSRPPQGSLASFWQRNPDGNALMTLVCPVGTIIDLVLDLIQNDQDATSTVAVATAVVGTIYYLALDHTVSDKLIPVSLSTTV